MIYTIIGKPGDGKTISAIRYLVHRPYRVFTNFVMFGKKFHRIRVSDIIKGVVESYKKDGSPKVVKYDVNYDFWNKEIKVAPFDICIDELHNIAGGMNQKSKTAEVMGRWISQIRKILGQHEKNHIYNITQRTKGITKTFQDLSHRWIFCEKVKLPKLVDTKLSDGSIKRLPLTIIKQKFFNDEEPVKECMEGGNPKYLCKDAFYANRYFRYYDSYELIQFSEVYI